MTNSSYHSDENPMTYVRVATGHRPGGPNITVPGAPATVKSDKLTNYGVGLKGYAFERRVLMDIQLTMADLRLGANAAYTRAYVASLVPGAQPRALYLQLPSVPKWSGALTGDYSFPVSTNWSGDFHLATRFIGSRHSNPVEPYSDGAGTPSAVLPAYVDIDTSAGISSDGWSIRLFVENLADKRAYT